MDAITAITVKINSVLPWVIRYHVKPSNAKTVNSKENFTGIVLKMEPRRNKTNPDIITTYDFQVLFRLPVEAIPDSNIPIHGIQLRLVPEPERKWVIANVNTFSHIAMWMDDVDGRMSYMSHYNDSGYKMIEAQCAAGSTDWWLMKNIFTTEVRTKADTELIRKFLESDNGSSTLPKPNLTLLGLIKEVEEQHGGLDNVPACFKGCSRVRGRGMHEKKRKPRKPKSASKPSSKPKSVLTSRPQLPSSTSPKKRGRPSTTTTTTTAAALSLSSSPLKKHGGQGGQVEQADHAIKIEDTFDFFANIADLPQLPQLPPVPQLWEEDTTADDTVQLPSVPALPSPPALSSVPQLPHVPQLPPPPALPRVTPLLWSPVITSSFNDVNTFTEDAVVEDAVFENAVFDFGGIPSVDTANPEDMDFPPLEPSMFDF